MQQPAVIFDIDGVLIDSYQAHLQSWQQVAVDHGREMTESQFAATFGQTSRDIIRQLWTDASLSEQQVTALDDEKEAAFRDIITADYPLMPGALELIDSLQTAGFLLAVGSSGPPKNVELTLDKLDRHSVIGAAVTGSDVTRGKPDPQVFQIAAARLDVPPARCVVVEDAAVGVAAANSAEMLSVALVSTGHIRDEYDAAAHIIERLDQISPDILLNWLDAAER